jgi:hypothetical protein
VLVDVLVEVLVEVEVVEAGVPTPAGGGFHPRKVVPAHEPESMLLRRPHSL